MRCVLAAAAALQKRGANKVQLAEGAAARGERGSQGWSTAAAVRLRAHAPLAKKTCTHVRGRGCPLPKKTQK